MRAKQTGREERATCPVYTAVRFIAMLCCECLSALWVIASGAGGGFSEFVLTYRRVKLNGVSLLPALFVFKQTANSAAF